MDKIEKFFQSKKLRILIGVLFVLGIILFIFQAGVFVGYKKALFSGRLGDNYYRGLEGGEENGNMNFLDFNAGNLPSANGASGSILKISLPNILIADKDGVEKTILVTDDTIFREFRNDISATDLKIGDLVVVVGSPNDNGEIQANLVRVLPPPPFSPASPASLIQNNSSSTNTQ